VKTKGGLGRPLLEKGRNQSQERRAPDRKQWKFNAQMEESDGKRVKINWKKDGSYAGNLRKPTATQADIDGEWRKPIARKADAGQKPVKAWYVKGGN
jgi:hypothetical protein